MVDHSPSTLTLETKNMETFAQEYLSTPFIIDGALSEWPAQDWTVNKLALMLEGKDLRCRLMPRDRRGKGEPAWESEGVYVHCQLRDFSAWCQGEASPDNPLSPFCVQDFSAYIDYKYMTDVFADCPERLTGVKWKSLGLNNMDGSDSTLWIGSTGASTPCHYDTYGFNLVAQIQGRKRWVLFPPEAGRGMYPTRVPYEESSVFSQVDLASPDLCIFPEFKKLQPVVITLEPGQVLYVPRQWWHYVTCVETAVSINAWVGVPEDNASRLQEAVTRVLASALIPYLAQTAGPSAEEDWINPTEELQVAALNVEFLKTTLSLWKQSYTDNLATENVPKREEENAGKKDEQATVQKPGDSISERTITAVMLHAMTSNSNQNSAQKDTTGGISEQGTLPELDCLSSTLKPSTGFTQTSPGGVNLLQVAQTLQHCPLHHVSSPFALSHYLGKSVGPGTPSSVCLQVKTSSDLLRTQEDTSTDNVKRKRRKVQANVTVSDVAETELEVYHQTPQKLYKKDTGDTNVTEFVSAEREGGDTLAVLEKLHANSNSAGVKMSVFVPKSCRLQEYLPMTKQEDHGVVLSKGKMKGSASCGEQGKGVKQEKEEVSSHFSENQDSNTENVAAGSVRTGHGSVQTALLRSVMQPHVITTILEELLKQV